MRILLDTHVLIWWLLDDTAIPAGARAAITDEMNDMLVSAATAWEISIKYKSGKLPNIAPLMISLETAILDEGFTGLPITLRHAELAGGLPPHHKDPFDRMLIAQALAESLTLISHERLFDRYGVVRLW
ncbi:MAG TPA: type II toxin-antitoxin system VapC family toxin [Stellaceae bacterium]|nr:type II toxin-antitoxin system VapC family toxin [Stellaceae bacterium]